MKSNYNAIPFPSTVVDFVDVIAQVTEAHTAIKVLKKLDMALSNMDEGATELSRNEVLSALDAQNVLLREGLEKMLQVNKSIEDDVANMDNQEDDDNA